MKPCQVCRRSLVYSPHVVCDNCYTGASDALYDLIGLIATLSDMMMPGSPSGDGGASPNKTASKPPAPLPVLSLLGPDKPNTNMSAWLEDQSGPPSILSYLGGWRRAFQSEMLAQGYTRGLTEGWATASYDAQSAVTWLHVYARWAERNHPEYASFVRETLRYRKDCQRVIDNDNTIVRLGRCPIRVESVRCRYLLCVRPDAVSIKCPKCGESWPRWEWQKLGDDMKKAEQMSDVEREVPEDGDMPQEEQGRLLTRTGNQATVVNQDAILESVFGPPDENGIYGKNGEV